ncbi:MAG TPA: hypothetical protein VKV26_22100 [Dehalococcoidia bacterium]|nr:hypothetical protein [Dehalococcoidia bacterium]
MKTPRHLNQPPPFATAPEGRRLTRRSALGLGLIAAAGGALLTAAPVSAAQAFRGASRATAVAPTGKTASSASPAQAAAAKSLVPGWYRGNAVKYYDFGTNTKLAGGNVLAAAPIYLFITGMNADGTPNAVKGQHNIVDLLQGQPGYSDLWQINFVSVPASYAADTAKSLDEITAAGFGVAPANMFVNCPLVPQDTTLEDGKQLTQGWYDGQPVFYPDFGLNPDASLPIYALVNGFDAQGNPQAVAGQNNIIDSVPTDQGYSAFWRVNFVTVPAGYVANTLRSAADVVASGFPIMQSNTIVNCPVRVENFN